MKKKHLVRKVFIWILSVLLVVCVGFGGYGLARYIRFKKADGSTLCTKADNIVMMIGDGMGFNHLEVAKAYLEKEELEMQKLPIKSASRTDSLTPFAPTDSAAGATALSTGNKVFNSNVGRLNGKDLENICEIAKAQGKGVGIVCTDSLSGATPASFSAHADARGEEQKIIADQISSQVDIFLGSGYSTYVEYKTQIEQAGFLFTNQFENLSLTEDRIFASFSSIANDNYTSETPSLQSLAEFAMEFLSAKYPQGYFLMVEGSHIDKRSHKNDIFGMVDYLREFDKTIAAVKSKLIENNKDNLLIVTADHETGNLQYNGETKTQIGNHLYKSTGHTAKDVPIFIWANQSFKMPKRVENTALFYLMKNSLLKTA